MKRKQRSEINACAEGKDGSAFTKILWMSGYVSYGLGLAIKYLRVKIKNIPTMDAASK